MSKRIKWVLIIIVLLSTFIYGYLFGVYKIFPFKQLMAAKHFVELKFDRFESFENRESIAVTVKDTFLKRLLIKKIKLGQNIGSGGGLTTTDRILYVVSNKGSIMAFDTENYYSLEINADNVPMNFDELLLSGHPYQNGFQMTWFRVNGLHSERTDRGTHNLYVSHNGYNPQNDCITYNISRLELAVQSQSVNQVDGWHNLFTASPCIDPVPENWLGSSPYSGHISGGKIVQFDDKRLLISIGDYNKHGLNGADLWAMDASNPYGKFILLNKESGEWSVFAKGTRNPAGLFIDQSGIIWSVENGPMGGDELNIIERDRNYGWPMVSYGIWYDMDYELPGKYKRGTHNDFTKPIFSWADAIATSNLIKIEGDKFDHWKGDLILGTMRNQSLRRLRLDNENRVIYDEQINFGHRIRDITTLHDDTIVLFTDDGQLIFIDDGGPIFKEMGPEEAERIANLERYDNLIKGSFSETEIVATELSARSVFDYNCSSCHGMQSSSVGPHLNDIFEREIGNLDNFNYSAVLQNEDRQWTPQLMKSFLLNPEAEFYGNSMPKINLTSAEADSIIQYLQQ